MLGQRTELPAGSRIGDVVLGPLRVSATHEWAADPAVRAVLDGLGIKQGSKPGSPTSTARWTSSPAGSAAGSRWPPPWSGSATCWCSTSRPTTSTSTAVNWLAEHLVSRRAALVVVTHDRWLLDAVCTRTWEVVDGRVEQLRRRLRRLDLRPGGAGPAADAAEARRRNLARKELAWLRRGPPARTSKPRFRIEAAEALIADEPPPRNGVELMSFATRRLGRTVLELEDVAVERGRPARCWTA